MLNLEVMYVPRYFRDVVFHVNGKLDFKSVTSVAGILIGSASDFDSFILYPERALKRLSSVCRIGRVVWG